MKSVFLIFMVLMAFQVNADVAQDVVIEKSFARAAIIQQRNSAAFMNITNQGSSSAAIVTAKSPIAKIVELHTHINDKGVMRMRKIRQIDLPSNEVVKLKPGGLHIMLLGLNQNLKPGDEISVTLGFNDGSEKSLQVPVQKRMMRMKKNMDAHKADGSLPKLMTH